MSSESVNFDRIAMRWGLDASDVDGIDALLDGMRATYARVEALAAEYVPRTSVRAPWNVERVGGADEHHAWMYRTTGHYCREESGPLQGRRLAVKDSIAVAGVPMTAGGAFLRGFVPKRSAVAVERALDAGATLVGTAVCEDLCHSGSSFTSATGAVLNPYNPAYAAGGSTSGCGVLLATGQADIALGTDLGGSVRNPAAWCGVSALKATFGLVPYAGALATEFSMDHLGLMARKAVDLAKLLDAVAGPSVEDPRQVGGGRPKDTAAGIGAPVSDLRVGIVEEGFGWPDRSDPELDAIVRTAAAALAQRCLSVQEVSISLHRHARDIHVPISCEGGLATMFEQNSQGSNHAGAYDPDLALAFGEALDKNIGTLPINGKISLIVGTLLRYETRSRVMALAQMLRARLRAQFDAALERFDLLVMPTVPMLPHRLPHTPLDPAEHQKLAFEMHDNNCATNLTGHPALSIPCGMLHGFPVGMLLIGRHLEDHLLLRAANWFQSEVFVPPPPPSLEAKRFTATTGDLA